MGTQSCEKHTVHWFRKGLRLHDNPALREGLRSAKTFRCVFIIDPWFAGSSNVGINKWRFLLQCLEDLDRSLRALNSRLFVIRGQPADALPKLFREWGTTNLTFEEDPEPFGRVRDHNIKTMCREIGISVVSKGSHTLYKLDEIIEKNGGKAPVTYQQFQSVIAGMDAPPGAEPAVTSTTIGAATTPLNDDHDDKYGVPTLEELGFDTESLTPPTWVGGEQEALSRLDKHLERKAWVASFCRPKMTPQSLLPSKTGLSPYLRFGCLSTRLFYYQLTDLYKKIKKARPPLSLHGQLLWREFFYCAATNNSNFDRMAGNPICVQIPWDKNADALSKWANGQTGFPWIDAIMIQLREEGWIHHLARHAVACFLTRGDLWISWEEGMKVFEELLLDADWSVNAGMWMWLSSSSFFQHFFHCYCPIRFGRKADPNGDYIRKYIPALKDFPTRYIHAPWQAPEEVQAAACCIIGRDYPRAMLDHDAASKFNIQRIKQVYRQLAKSKSSCEENCKNENLVVQQMSRPNTVMSSPSPTSVITTLNHSTYLCSTSPPTPTNQYNTNNNDEQNEQYLDNRKLIQDDYENCNKTLADIFQDKQERNTTGVRVRNNTPFKKIIIVDQDYETMKSYNNQNHYTEMGRTIESYVAETQDNERYGGSLHRPFESINGDFTNKNCYPDRSLDSSYADIGNNSYSKSHYSSATQDDKTILSGYYYKTGADTNRYVMANENGFSSVNLNEGIYAVRKKRYDLAEKGRSKQPFSYDYQKYSANMRRKSESDSSDSFQDQTYDSRVINDRMFDNACHKLRKNYSFRTCHSTYGSPKSMNYQRQANYDNVPSPDFNYSSPMKESPDQSVGESSSGSRDGQEYGRSEGSNRHDYSLVEENVRFQQGKTVVMQGCTRPSDERPE